MTYDTTRLASWIAEHATATDDENALIEGLCRGLTEMGLPLWRVSISTPTIDPVHRGISLNWHAEQGGSRVLAPHGAEQEAVWLRSPIIALLQSGEQFARWRLDKLGTGDDYPLLHELRMQNGTDYVLFLIGFAPGTALRGVAFSMTTQRASGFDQAEITAVGSLLPALGLAMAKLSLSHTLREVLATYLGPTTGGRVLNGQIRRGQGEKVPAAILLVDLRAFTKLSDCADPADVVRWLDEHFDALGKPVADHGGEILKFLGDGFLAAFPVPDASAQPCTGCGLALAAAAEALRANEALNALRRTTGLPALEADLVLHYGEVIYGNVGTSRRLDFTLIGRAVNEASRIEAHCEILGHALLISDSFAARCDQSLEEVGSVTLRGVTSPQRVWTSPLNY
ncbi:adenylate/guanylate cyclase domain-containing protein [Methylobacterium sp. BTF04]|uniref:adenylate/guanylate cyclase domain-containing protein n=1 Tax=Methylobacterium sp. BTF04 TaxID=2708300 RepID=UPI0013D2F20A|nr:adenylate/guanylate cyclase domain-containing protein [Methylobacterium sp. BTF04]NEU14890.1 adenylate/guanylate cyclase domain-containing protein [Methylobacterium sp. BTF04]